MARVPSSVSRSQVRLQAPAVPVYRHNVLVGFLEVGDAHVGAIPFEFLAGEPDRQVAHYHCFGERACVVEVGAGGRATLAGVDPVLLVRALDPRQGLRRALDGGLR
jgi:hypothetical protein